MIEVLIPKKCIEHISLFYTVTYRSPMADEDSFIKSDTSEKQKMDEPPIKLYDEVSEWLSKNMQGEVRFNQTTMFFENADDAILFKLIWG